MSDLSINKIKARIGNAARPNKFSVYFFCPKLGISVEGVLCKAVQLPGKQIEATAFSTYGVLDSMPTSLSYDGQRASFTFMCDNSFADKQIFETWLNYIFGGATGSEGNDQSYKPTFSYQEEYTGQVHVNHFRPNGDISHTVILHDAFPVQLNPQQLDYDSIDQVLTMDSQFAFRYTTTDYKPAPQRIGLDGLLNTGRQILDVAGDVASVVDTFGGDGSSLRRRIQSASGTIDSAGSLSRTLSNLGLPSP